MSVNLRLEVGQEILAAAKPRLNLFTAVSSKPIARLDSRMAAIHPKA